MFTCLSVRLRGIHFSKSCCRVAPRATESPILIISATQGVLGLASGALVGFSLGLVGGGGSILAVPLMVYVVGVPDAHVAIGTSAIAVATNAAVNLSNHARGRTAVWSCALTFAAAGIIRALCGSVPRPRRD